MKLNRNSWHYKMWENSFEDFVPHTTDLCRYCHRIFWQLMFYVLMGLIALTMLYLACYCLIYRCLILHPLATLIFVGVVATLLAAITFYHRWLNRNRSYQEPKTLVGKWMRARKEQVCPLVEFTDKE